MPESPRLCQPGETKEEAIVNIKEAIEGYILTLKDDNLPVSEETYESMMVVV